MEDNKDFNKGLIIKEPWIHLILEGEKTFEIRGSNTKIRGKVALIKSKSGQIFGTAELVDSIPLSLEEFIQHQDKHCIPITESTILPYPKTYAWVIQNTVIFNNPIPYKHPQGEVIWVKL